METEERLERLERQVDRIHRIVAQLCSHVHVVGPPAMYTAADRTLKAQKRRAVELALVESGGDKKAAARALGVSVKTLYNLLKGEGKT